MNTSADATGTAVAARAKIKAARQTGDIPDININDMVMFCGRQGPARHARAERGADRREALPARRIHLGFACDTDKGLLVPVIRNCQKLSLAELSAQGERSHRQALEGSIGLDDLTRRHVHRQQPRQPRYRVLYADPESAASRDPRRGFHRAEARQRGHEKVEFVDHIGLSLTCDHQVIDGAPGARFLKVLREKIETLESIADLKL